MEMEINWLTSWYSQMCNGDWEHEYGIKIDTIANPGWSISIDLSDSDYEKILIEYQLTEISEKDWYGYSVKDGIYKGSGDPSKLLFLIGKFKEIITEFDQRNRKQG